MQGYLLNHCFNLPDENIMSFKLEKIQPGDLVESTDEYKRAVAIAGGLKYPHRIVDLIRGISLYCVFVNAYEERPPGEYLLFFKSHIVVIYAYNQPKKQADGSLATTFRIDSWELPQALQSDKELVREVIIEALKAEGFASVLPITSVTVEFPNNL
jgi:hypothetical protein